MSNARNGATRISTVKNSISTKLPKKSRKKYGHEVTTRCLAITGEGYVMCKTSAQGPERPMKVRNDASKSDDEIKNHPSQQNESPLLALIPFPSPRIS